MGEESRATTEARFGNLMRPSRSELSSACAGALIDTASQLSSKEYFKKTEPAIRTNTAFDCPQCSNHFSALGAVKQHVQIEHPVLVTCGGYRATVSELD